MMHALFPKTKWFAPELIIKDRSTEKFFHKEGWNLTCLAHFLARNDCLVDSVGAGAQKPDLSVNACRDPNRRAANKLSRLSNYSAGGDRCDLVGAFLCKEEVIPIAGADDGRCRWRRE